MTETGIPGSLLQLGPLRGRLWRMVEHQEQVATRAITSNLSEQSRLEELLEAHKPRWLPGSEGLHWLLRTPFRYPPLPYGSRFGSATEPGVLYAAEQRETAMTEAATYLWLFRAGPRTAGPLDTLEGGRTALAFTIDTPRAADLCRPETATYHPRISDPGSWSFTQPLGTALRSEGCELIRYPSARHAGGINGAVIAPAAVAGNRRPRQEHWAFRLDVERCWWGRSDGEAFEILHEDLADPSGRIPHPAL